jgi:hypothetical protein
MGLVRGACKLEAPQNNRRGMILGGMKDYRIRSLRLHQNSSGLSGVECD